MICPRCQESMKDGARFCSNCGISFSSWNTPTERATDDLPDTLPDIDPLVGQALDGKYELLARLGEGGMGVVYRARRVHIGDEVAVKVLPRKFVADRDLVERFRREARAAALLRHPNVVMIHDYGEAGEDDAPAYIVMELVEGTSLRQLLQHEGCLSPERVFPLMRDICAGVGAAHRRGIFHRDLKPDNIIVIPPDDNRECETVKVVDFGIAKLRDPTGAPTLTQTGMILGTPYYMSPEQCRGEPLDARSDVYSLGAMFYEMLTSKPPFTAPSTAGVLAKHITEAPQPLPHDLQVPSTLEAVIMRSLAKDQDTRQADATELLRQLRSAEAEARRHREAEAQRQKEEEQQRWLESQAAKAAEEERRRGESEENQFREAETQQPQVEDQAHRRSEENELQTSEDEETNRSGEKEEEPTTRKELETSPPTVEKILPDVPHKARHSPAEVIRNFVAGKLPQSRKAKEVMIIICALVMLVVSVIALGMLQATNSPDSQSTHAGNLNEDQQAAQLTAKALANVNSGKALTQENKKREADAEYLQAQTHFKDAIILKPDDPKLRASLASVLILRELWSEAANEYREAQRLDPSNLEYKEALKRLENKKKPPSRPRQNSPLQRARRGAT